MNHREIHVLTNQNIAVQQELLMNLADKTFKIGEMAKIYALQNSK